MKIAKIGKLAVVAGVPILVAGCLVPTPISIATYGIDAISYLATGKTVTEHVVSELTGQNCSFFRVIDGEDICRDYTPEEQHEMMLAEQRMNTGDSRYTASLREGVLPSNEWDPEADTGTTMFAQSEEPSDAIGTVLVGDELPVDRVLASVAPTAYRAEPGETITLEIKAKEAPPPVRRDGAPITVEPLPEPNAVPSRPAASWTPAPAPAPSAPVAAPTPSPAPAEPAAAPVQLPKEKTAVPAPAFLPPPAAPSLPRPTVAPPIRKKPPLARGVEMASLPIPDKRLSRPSLSTRRAAKAAPPADSGSVYLVIGSFLSRANAARAAGLYSAVRPSVATAVVNGIVYHRVVAGPYSNEHLDAARARIEAATGVPNAWRIRVCGASGTDQCVRTSAFGAPRTERATL